MRPVDRELWRASFDGKLMAFAKALAAGAHIDCVNENGATPLYVAAQEGHADVIVMLLAAGANVDLAKKNGVTPLFIAAEHNHADVVDKLLAAGANVDLAMNNGATPVFQAAQEGHADVIVKLLAAGANVDLAMNTGATPLHIAAQNGHAGVVDKLLAAGANVDLAANNGATPLSIAAQKSHASIVDKLLAAGANVDLACTDGATPLFGAAQNGHAVIVDKLLAAGANVDLAWNTGATPLLQATQEGHAVIVDKLLAAGANVNLACTDGSTPLFVAAQNGHPDIVDKLLAVGANVDLACTDGATPVFIAAHNDHAVIVDKLLAVGANVDLACTDGATPLFQAAQNDHAVIVDKLLAAGANVDLACSDRTTPLHVAAGKGHASIVDKLLAAGANLDLASQTGATALYVAAENGHAGVVDKLLAAGANVDLAMDDGYSPLHIAAHQGHVVVVEKLLAAGANVDLLTNHGSSPLSIAAEHGHIAIVIILLDSGASVDSLDGDGDSALLNAAFKSHADVAFILIEAGADTSIRNKKGMTAAETFETNGDVAAAKRIRDHKPSPTTFRRAIERGNLDLMRRLANNPDFILSRWDHGRTPLHQIAKHGHIEMIKILLANGAKLIARDDYGWMPLHVACATGNIDAVRVLLEVGANPSAVDDQGLSCLDVGALHGHFDVVEVLVDRGGSLSNISIDGRTVLHHVVLGQNPLLVEYMLTKEGIDVNAVDGRGWTALHYAIQSATNLGEIVEDGRRMKRDSDAYELWRSITCTAPSETLERKRLSIIQMLLTADGIDVNKLDDTGATALHIASKCGDTEAVRLLLLHEARTDLADKSGRTALVAAASSDVRSVIQLYHNRQQYHTQCHTLLRSEESAPTVTQLTELVPLITSVYDLRLLLTVSALLPDDAVSRSRVLLEACNHVMKYRLTFDVDACVFFKLTLEHCEREQLLTRRDVLKFDRIAENINTEGAEWVVEIKRQVHLNRWRLDRHEQHLHAMATSIHHVHAMVVENRNAILETSSRVDVLKTQVVHGRKMLGELVAHARHMETRVQTLKQRLVHNESNTNKMAAHLLRHAQHVSARLDRNEQHIRRNKENTRRVVSQLAKQAEKVSALATHFDERISSTEKYVTHVATQFSDFQQGYLDRLEQEKKNQRIKAVCGVVASVVGFVFAPLLQSASSAVVDLVRPLELVKLCSAEDPANFLSGGDSSLLKDGVCSLLEKHAIAPDTFEDLLREAVALKHPELAEDCKRRGLNVYKDSGNAELVRANAPSLEKEEEDVGQLVTALRAALDNIATQDAMFKEAEAAVSLPSVGPDTGEHADAKTDAMNFDKRGEAVPHAMEKLQTTLKSADNQREFAQRFAAATARGPSITPPQETPLKQPVDRVGRHEKVTKEKNIEPTAEQPDKASAKEDSQRIPGDSSQITARTSPPVSESNQVTILSELDAFPYHAAVEKSHGDVSNFQALTEGINNNADVHAPAETRLTEMTSTREVLCAAEYAYLLGYRDVGDVVGARMSTPVPDFDESPALSVQLEGDVDAFPYFFAVAESEGDVDECEDFLDTLDEDAHTVEDTMSAIVVRETRRVVSWTVVEYACHLGYVEVVKHLLKELCKTLPPKTRILAIKQARERAKVLGSEQM